jgi:hypothetical protein
MITEYGWQLFCARGTLNFGWDYRMELMPVPQFILSLWNY